MTLRTSSSHDEGGTRQFAVSTVSFDGGDDGALRSLRLVKVAQVVEDGRMRFERIPGTEFVVPAELALLAIGFSGAKSSTLHDQLGVEVDARGNALSDAAFQTNVDGVFVAGDAVRGPSLVVWALSDGREAARSADAWLTGGVRLPTRGKNRHFGGR
jgi:glutamate synthase (NADPH/NADH) small chain